MKVKDPVCGMQMEKGEAEAVMDYKETTYYFCSKECRDLFAKNPQQYFKSQGISL